MGDGNGGAAKRGPLEVITQIFGLFAGLAAVIYFTGAVVLSLRLAFEHLPWGNVVSQLPREFVLSVGAGQVLLPSLVVGALYGVYRLLRDDAPTMPNPSRWRQGGVKRLAAFRGYVIALAAMLVPLGVVLFARGVDSGFEPQAERIIAACFALTIAAIAAREARAVVIQHFGAIDNWNGIKGTAAMAGVYSILAIPAMTVAASAIPLSDAKVCTAEYEERGALVGESSDRIYLGEARSSHRRLAEFPLAKVEEVFIGPKADTAKCEFASASAPSSSKQKSESSYLTQPTP